MTPQYLPLGCEQATCQQPAPIAPQTPAVPPPPQVWPTGQPPQSRLWPQPSPIVPQYLPFGSMHATGVHAPAFAAQTPGMPLPPQVWPVGQPPQLMILPQP